MGSYCQQKNGHYEPTMQKQISLWIFPYLVSTIGVLNHIYTNATCQPYKSDFGLKSLLFSGLSEQHGDH
jgi:hypothetical protein